MNRHLLKITVLVLISISNLAMAADSWLGNVQVRETHRGTVRQWELTGQPLSYNLADYSLYLLSFELYKDGVTNIPNVPVWEKINVEMVLVKDSTQQVLKR